MLGIMSVPEKILYLFKLLLKIIKKKKQAQPRAAKD